MFSAIKNTTNFLAHLVPLRTPIALSHFITVIETIRQMIRPITLSVRIAANITAGHILIALVRAPIIILNPITLVLIILFLLEVAVAFIQRYVFTLLLTIYLRETN
jgi:ATP synthase subunit 6